MSLEKGNGAEEQNVNDLIGKDEKNEEPADSSAEASAGGEASVTDNCDDDAFADPAEEEDTAPGESFFSDDDGKLPEIFLNDQYDGMEEEPKPMSYRDEESYNYQQPQFFVPTVSRRDADDLLFPPFSSPGKGKGIYLLKTLMWMASVVIAAMAIFLIFRIIDREAEPEKQEERIPYNFSTDASYAEEPSVSGAPKVSADPNGPQISTLETDSEFSTNPVNQAYRKTTPSVVCITSYKGGEDFVLDKIGDGSGIIISKDGYIATNSHVLDDDKETGVLVTLADGTQYLGTIVGMDTKTDLAVLKIDAKDLTAAEFADSDKLFVGQEVYAIGNPGGSNFSNSLTKGTVSALNRTLSTNGYVRYIQTDAAINPGNSGGPLINDNGQVIGMNTAKIVNTKYEGMGFSIPSNKVAEIVNKLIKYGYVNDRGTIGIEGSTCNLYESKKKNVPQGMVITSVSSTGALAGVDVRNHDIITAINGVRVKSVVEFIDELSKYKPGDVVTLSIFRASDNMSRSSYSFDVNVTLLPDN